MLVGLLAALLLNEAHAQPPTPGEAPAPASGAAPTTGSTPTAASATPPPADPTAPAEATPPAPATAPATTAPTDAAATARFAPAPAARLRLELELVTHARLVRRDGDDLSELRLDRGELGGRIAVGPHAAAELRLEAVRSAVEGGALGIDGDSTVVRVKYAQVTGTYAAGPVVLDGALGFVPDPWLRALEVDYPLRPLSRTGSERLLGWPTADLAGLVRARFGPVRATVAVGNGEGQRFPERNTGKTTTGVVEVVPIATPQLRVTASAVARDGSIGVASLRDRRFGGGLAAVTPWARGGAEVVQAYGIGDRGEAEGLLAAGWLEARVIDRVFVGARGATLGFADDGGRLSTFGGAIAVEPWREPAAGGRLRVWLAVDRVTSSGGAMPLPGADAGEATVVMLVASALAPFTVE